MTVARKFRYLNRGSLLPHFGFFFRRRRLDRGAVGVGFAIDSAGEFLVGFPFLLVFSLAFGERGGAFTFSDS
ncbi:MAG: hypothetical protein ACKVP0_06040 [Pirellulaceae bacterium]